MKHAENFDHVRIGAMQGGNAVRSYHLQAWIATH